uniref:Uncharacterized protein n=1 Tax=Eutreptiella gymnastica TaxID=73025 RepID=A0A7S1IMV8_9EUGL
MYATARRRGICRVTRIATVTAGLMCPPEMCPKQWTRTKIVRPKVRETVSLCPPFVRAVPANADEDEEEHGHKLGYDSPPEAAVGGALNVGDRGGVVGTAIFVFGHGV